MPDAIPQFTIDPSGTKKVILSVDGGGMRGAIPIAMLAELENQTGKTCQQMFDMVAGTSTGAIIAVGLAIGMTANQLLDQVYRQHLPKGFENAGRIGLIAEGLADALKVFGIGDNEFLARLVSHSLHYAYPLGPFLEQLKPLVGCQTVGDLKLTDPKRPILFVTTKDIATRETNFIVSAGKGKGKFQEWPLPAVVAC